MKKAVYLLLTAGVLLCLLQVLLPTYFMTCDGPCHVYNSFVLHKFGTHKDEAFYGRFYLLNSKPNPNWLTHILLTLLMYVTDGIAAEKILLCAYILLFTGGFYMLLRRLNDQFSIWPLVALVFVFHFAVIWGFYNFSFSVAMFFWLILAWLRYLEKQSFYAILVFSLCVGATFFAHPLAFVFGCVTCVALLLSYGLSGSLNMYGEKKSRYIIPLLSLCIIFLPFVIYFMLFANSQSGIGSIHIHLDTHRFWRLFNFYYMAYIRPGDDFFTKAIAIVLVALFLFSLIFKYIRARGVYKYDGFFAGLLFALFVYLCFPDWLLGGGLLILRAQLFVFIFVCLCIACMPVFQGAKNVAAAALYGCFLFVSIARFHSIFAASRAEADYLSPVRYIKPYSVVLPLSFCNGGRDEKGNLISDQTVVFNHAASYLGLQKPLIILDNYEANTSYFPLTWKQSVNPYIHMSKEEGFDGLPPYAAIEDYTKVSGIVVNYIITWCYDSSFSGHGHVDQMMQQIKDNYHIVYRSPSKRTVLYERN